MEASCIGLALAGRRGGGLSVHSGRAELAGGSSGSRAARGQEHWVLGLGRWEEHPAEGHGLDPSSFRGSQGKQSQWTVKERHEQRQ